MWSVHIVMASAQHSAQEGARPITASGPSIYQYLEQLVAVDKVLDDLVQSVTHVKLAIGIRRPIVQRKHFLREDQHIFLSQSLTHRYSPNLPAHQPVTHEPPHTPRQPTPGFSRLRVSYTLCSCQKACSCGSRTVEFARMSKLVLGRLTVLL